MKLLALLIGLVVERLATQLFHLRRLPWMDRAIDFGFRQAARFQNWPALIPIILLAFVLVAPVLAVRFGLGDICIVGEGEPAPDVALSIARTPEGVQIGIDARDFTFSRDLLGLYHVPGMGHGHLYVGGLKLGRLFEPSATIGALPPGEHVVRVTLNTNDHRAYVVDGVPVTASTTIVVD